MGTNRLFDKALAKHNAGNLDEAIPLYKMVLLKNQMHLDANYLLGTAYAETGKFDEAMKYLLKAEKIMPSSPYIKVNLGNVYKEQGRHESAFKILCRAVELKHDLPQAHCNLSSILYELDRLEEAELSCRRALTLDPASAEAHNNLGNILKTVGRFEEAEASFRRALELKTDFAKAQSDLLFTLNYVGEHTPSFLVEEARKYWRIVSPKATSPFTAWQCTPNPERLRVGVVSGDLCNHPVGYFLENVVKSMNYSRIELLAYTTWHKEDELTARIKPFFSSWKLLTGISDQAASKLIHEDRLHILLDLSGHTRHNRLPVFAWKPAPIQASWLGYFATTGMKEIDFLLGDPHVTPVKEEDYFIETIHRLPETYLCFTPPDVAVGVQQLPASSSGEITFGSFNNLTKINNSVIALWARILLAVPHSHLFLKTKQLNDQTQCAAILQRFTAHGISSDRITLEGASPRPELLATYNRVDIALDPFPYPGGTTSAEGLWMGVPFITLSGDRFLSHIGESIAHNVGLADWIAADENDYVAKAVKHAANIERLAILRSNLRQQVLASPLFDSSLFAKNFETALWWMWKQFQNRS